MATVDVDRCPAEDTTDRSCPVQQPGTAWHYQEGMSLLLPRHLVVELALSRLCAIAFRHLWITSFAKVHRSRLGHVRHSMLASCSSTCLAASSLPGWTGCTHVCRCNFSSSGPRLADIMLIKAMSCLCVPVYLGRGPHAGVRRCVCGPVSC